ncbi:MAG: Ribosomal RNA small subunit methyltransferase E [Ignavibacteriaceae bacterium]|jgi:16S rRNA (uracil1498-N3)-methyltransferase|nr:MAG: 16S rRNA (uracil(1498)-N(3))-methyltransferase [Chlorobiota bacterium]MBE7477170.1 16S rRNA (uracil(1498)-N(3))-methyltransferase [Ignavibacteriales bacterium]MBL1121372.1 16S rRNA (uracil(1498)-N(3))-methyltransferase [Ignavibacteriota bacterium]MBV6419644.1 Ribosomal RNA small subunit methyltransferase E [Ignavibacteriaceae bacterium]MCE7855206.1 16S rRNA (uracil(1498)-N(3))-methyltransferase [Ignavibacteria bacterium CHB3]MEB2297778.1 RsmE family RNA methyltransferase [Ignavibacteri
MVTQNGFSILAHLSDIELYYTPAELIRDDKLILSGDEFHHSTNVMRNKIGDTLYVTDGQGIIYTSKIISIQKSELSALIVDSKKQLNESGNIWFCIPSLKKPDRLKFAFEKCVELGIINFILFTSRNAVSTKVIPHKFQKTVLAAMKQSLRAFIPQILSSSFGEIMNLDGNKFLFDQSAGKKYDGTVNNKETTYFLFGPEGGFHKSEIEKVNSENQFTLSPHRLRSETAVVKCASLLNLT